MDGDGSSYTEAVHLDVRLSVGPFIGGPKLRFERNQFFAYLHSNYKFV